MEKLSRKLNPTSEERDRSQEDMENFRFGLKRERSTEDLSSEPLAGVSEDCSSSGDPQKPIVVQLLSDSNVIEDCGKPQPPSSGSSPRLLSSFHENPIAIESLPDSSDPQVSQKKRKLKKISIKNGSTSESIDTQVSISLKTELDDQPPERRIPISFCPDTSVPSSSRPNPIPSASQGSSPLHVKDETGSDFDSGSEVDSDDDDDDDMAFGLEFYDVMVEYEVEDQPEPLSDQFNWSDDYTTFTGKKEDFLGEAGPSTDASSPYDIFTKIWDDETMKFIVDETNRYASTTIAEKCEFKDLPRFSRLNSWKEITVDELYVFFGVLIYMSLCVRGNLKEYWTTGTLEMPKFRALMSRNRFGLILRFLHFCNNYHLYKRGPQRKLAKIKPLLDVINAKFSELYTPHQSISIDESPLLCRSCLTWAQYIKRMAALNGIKTYKLCEATTGYLYRFIVCTEQWSMEEKEPVAGFINANKVVLRLMDGLFDKGYCVFMDSLYNRISLMRYLKSRRTDVVGTINRREGNVPPIVKTIGDNLIQRGDRLSRHCGDVSVIAWNDNKLVTAASTYHSDEMGKSQRVGENYPKPTVILDYNSSFMAGADIKDEQLDMYLTEQMRGIKWYIKVFRRILNTSILNSIVIHRHNDPSATKIGHRDFRYNLASELIRRHRPNVAMESAVSKKPAAPAIGRLVGNGDGHFLFKLAKIISDNRRSRRKCARCAARGIYKPTTTYCIKCNVPLCIGQCLEDYHTVENLAE